MPKTVLMIGAGAVEGGWDAVHAALRRIYPHVTRPACELAFASTVHRLRWLAHSARSPADKAGFARAMLNYERLKVCIAEELTKALTDGRLSFRKYGRELLTRLRGESPDLKIITTNWDKTLDAEIPEPLGEMGRLYLHGIATTPSTLYLPTEALDEVYRDGKTARELRSMRNAHLLAATWIRNCDRLAIYGLSLSPLDPELGMVTAAGFFQRRKPCAIEIHDINPGQVGSNLEFYRPNNRSAAISLVQIR